MVAPGIRQAGCIVGVDGAVQAAWLRLHANAVRADGAVDQHPQRAAKNVVVALQVTGNGPQRGSAPCGDVVWRFVAQTLAALGAGGGAFVVSQHSTGAGAAHGGLGKILKIMQPLQLQRAPL